MSNPQATSYDPHAIDDFFDTCGEKEWERLERVGKQKP
jgi:hypothetical protein